MTQPPENTGGQPAGGRSPGDQDAGAPVSAPPPDSWHFPPGGPGGSGPAYGPSPQYGAPPRGIPPPGPPPPYAAPQPYGAAYPPYAAGFPVGPEPDLAEWWRRLLGRLIDLLVLSALATPIALAVLSHAFGQYQRIIDRYPDLSAPGAQAAISRADGRLFGAWLVFVSIVAVLSFCYDSIQHGLWGQTLGKRALGTRVVSAYDRSKISGGTAAGRAAMYALIPVVPLAGSLFSLLNALWLTWDRRRQCLHDKAARTIVVKTGFQAPRPAPPGSPW
jgi:uncharacterized RDD family membrane protein YckC